MEIVEVKTKKDKADFNKVPFLLHSKNPNWVPHIKQDIEKVFTPKDNPFFTHGRATRWILKDNSGKLIGRVAAFVNDKVANTFKQPTGGMGFFECTDNKEAAFLLFDTCKKWLEQLGMEAMDGPINFGENNKYWGLIIQNFEDPTYYGQNYNPEYYVQFFEDYGFQVYYNQHVYRRAYNAELHRAFQLRSERISRNPDYEVRRIDKSKLDEFTEYFRTIYNRAWQTHDNFKEMSKDQAFSIMKTMKPVIDENLIYFTFFKGKPVAFYISLPELNMIFKHVNGNMNWWGKLKFLYYKWKGVATTSFAVVFGVDPDFQGKGLEGFMFKEYHEVANSQPEKYKDLIITWIGDFNPMMMRIIEFLGGTEYRRLATYRKLFDPNAVFERAPIITKKENG